MAGSTANQSTDTSYRICPICGITFVPQHSSRQVFCSRRCGDLIRKDEKVMVLGYENFRTLILERDKYTCQDCSVTLGTRGLRLHHKVPVYMGGTNQLDNITTLCRKCHSERHSRFISRRV